jgi:hypothetical protein
MNSARKGTRREHQVIAELEGRGYRCIRSAASKGTFDLVAHGHWNVIAVQVKCNAWPPPAERRELEVAPVPDNWVVQCWRYDDREKPRVLTLCADGWYDGAELAFSRQTQEVPCQ